MRRACAVLAASALLAGCGGAAPNAEQIKKVLSTYYGAFAEGVQVRETVNGAIVWDGEVQVFDVKGHPSATRVYAWSHATGGAKRRFYAVLHAPPIDSPVKAVRASIVADSKVKKG